ncbi:hypothetical protein CHS0354_042783 [Potamilus streckersoni]|uniref:Uncharacterized protein n=1 Tax=Potamilus streckersoni TaxID=2493646 RepID=A0AAE0W863_9BIVA|nr:hypothetical protein CHS0354_042783 [Potamilus streckersoni]
MRKSSSVGVKPCHAGNAALACRQIKEFARVIERRMQGRRLGSLFIIHGIMKNIGVQAKYWPSTSEIDVWKKCLSLLSVQFMLHIAGRANYDDDGRATGEWSSPDSSKEYDIYQAIKLKDQIKILEKYLSRLQKLPDRLNDYHSAHDLTYKEISVAEVTGRAKNSRQIGS